MAFLCPAGRAGAGERRCRSQENTSSAARCHGPDRFESEAMLHGIGEIGRRADRMFSLGGCEWTPDALRRARRISDFGQKL